VPPFSAKSIQQKNFNGEFNAVDNQFGTHENDIERTAVLMFEIGTGLAAAEIKSVFEISSMQFSEDGKYLSMGSNKGSVCIWALGHHL
jgi:WD40 repeat protein